MAPSILGYRPLFQAQRLSHGPASEEGYVRGSSINLFRQTFLNTFSPFVSPWKRNMLHQYSAIKSIQ